MSDLDHIHPEFRHIAALNSQERIQFLEHPRWIGYKRATYLLELMEDLLKRPAKPRMTNLLIIGDSNNGKTTLIRRFKSLHGEGYVDDDNDPVKPIVLAESPPSADEKGLYLTLLKQFWAPHRVSDSKSKLRYQLIDLCRTCQVKMIILDEIHSLLTGSAIKQREVMNAIKLLCNELMIPIVGVGTREAVRVLHTDPQHASRFDVFPLVNWELNKEFQQLLADFERVLPLGKPSKLSSPSIASQLFSISGGNFGDLHRLLIECSREAIIQGKEQIDLDIIKGKVWIRPTRGIREVQL
ncbi:TniB family NTP-binding protein [Vibrio penaeicida]|uniref:TniB family NTP-binding protein n=1 Tax=Vibrio penaeicida TaxID=104609 RepID=UPI000CE9E72E|nr:TniB family NTP-binding protein [Vibrio penaeicida]